MASTVIAHHAVGEPSGPDRGGKESRGRRQLEDAGLVLVRDEGRNGPVSSRCGRRHAGRRSGADHPLVTACGTSSALQPVRSTNGEGWAVATESGTRLPMSDATPPRASRTYPGHSGATNRRAGAAARPGLSPRGAFVEVAVEFQPPAEYRVTLGLLKGLRLRSSASASAELPLRAQRPPRSRVAGSCPVPRWSS